MLTDCVSTRLIEYHSARIERFAEESYKHVHREMEAH